MPEHDYKLDFKIVPVDNSSYRIDRHYYNKEGELIETKRSSNIPFHLFCTENEQATKSFKPIILSFIDQIENPTLNENNVSGVYNGSPVNLNFPSETVSENFILKAIAKKKARETENLPNENIKHVIVKNIDKGKLQISHIYDNDEIQQQKIDAPANIPRNVILPLIKEIWGEKEQLQHLIEDTTVFSTDEDELYYLVRGGNGITLNVEVNKNHFDIFGIKAIEKTIYGEKLEFDKISAIEETVTNHYQRKTAKNK